MNKLKLISLLCTIAMLIGCFAMFPAFAAEAETEVETPKTVDAEGNGSGTADDPYLLYASNFADYYNNFASKYTASHVKMMENITLNEGDATEWAAGTNLPTQEGAFGKWAYPIGNEAALTGSFDGNGYTISGIYMSTAKRVGLFNWVQAGATVKNLSIKNSYFTNTAATDYFDVGGITARLNGTISNCYTEVIIKDINNASDVHVGGIAGRTYAGARINNCVFAGKVTTPNKVGGMLGEINATNIEITKSLNVGYVQSTGTNQAAGFVPNVLTNDCHVTIDNCMNLSSQIYANDDRGFDVYSAWDVTARITVTNFIVVDGVRANSKMNFNATDIKADGTTGLSNWNGTKLTVADLQDAETVTSKLPGWNFNSDSYVPNPTTLKGTDIAWTNFATKWVEGNGTGSGDANKLFTLDQSNFQTFWEKNKATGSIYGHYFLTSDVKLNDGKATDWANGSRPSNVWDVAIGGSNNGLYGGLFDGQGHTISGVCLIGGTSTRRTSLFAGVNNNATLKNVKLVNSYFEGHASGNYEEAAAFTSRLGGTIRNCYTDAIIVNNGTGTVGELATGGIAGRTHNGNLAAVTEAKIENCAFAGSVTTNGAMCTGGILGLASIKTTITNCTNAGTVTSNSSEGAARPGGILGHNNNAGTTINNCLNVGSITHVGGLSGGIIGNTAAGFSITHSMNLSLSVNQSVYGGGGWVTGDGIKLYNFVVVKGHADNKLVDSGGSSFATLYNKNTDDRKFVVYIDSVKDLFDADIVAKGAELEGWSFKEGFMAEPSGLVDITYVDLLNAKYWTTSDGGGTSGKWYSLDNDNFQQFWETNKGNNNGSFSGNFVLIDDITVNTGKSSDWATNREGVTVFTTTIKSLNGIFDGNGHTISGLCVYNDIDDDTNRFMGMFAVVNGIVRDLTIKNSYFYNKSDRGYDGTGAIAGRLGGSIINCHVASDVTVEHSGTTNGGTSAVGGLAGDGRGTAPTITDSSFSGVVKSSAVYTGGILGMTSNVTIISNCTNNGAVTSPQSMGGIVGIAGVQITISDCVNNGAVYSPTGHAAGILGYNGNANNKITGCVNNGTVTADANAAAGIVAGFNAKITVSNCVNTGTVTGTSDANGDAEGATAWTRPGGIVCNPANESIIKDCLNTGAIVDTAGNLSGGIVGNANTLCTVENCLNLSKNVESGNLYAGGHTGAVAVTSFYRVKGLGSNNYGSGANLATVTNATSGHWKNIKEISFAEFLNGTYLAGWVREDGCVPSPTANAKIDLINYVNKTTLGLDSTGAVHSVRISPDHPGLRFETKVDAAALAALADLGYTVELNTYITLASFVANTEFTAEALGANGMKVIKVPVAYGNYLRTVENNGYTAFAGSVTNVNDNNRYYAGIGCVTLTINGQSYNIYANYNAVETASVAGVAFLAARDTKAASETGYTNEIVDIYGNTVYSPYNEAQYKAIKVLMGTTPNTAILNYGLNGKISYTASMSNVSANAVSADEATDVYSDWTKWAAQGGCIVDGYIYTVMWSNNVDGKTNPNKCVIVKTNLSDGKVVAKSAALDLGHGNDLTFNGTDLVAVSCDSAKKVFFINPATLALDESRTKTLTVTPVSIDYDTVNNKYVVVDAQNTYVYIYDADFNLERTISGAGMTKGTAGTAIPDGSYSMQGIMTDGSYVYILGWHGGDTWAEEGSLSSLEHFFTSGIKSSIRVVDLASGAFVQDIDLGIEREVEFVDYENGTFYIGCNNSMWTGMEFYTGTIS